VKPNKLWIVYGWDVDCQDALRAMRARVAVNRSGTSPTTTVDRNKGTDMHWLDPDHLPEITGTVDRFLINPHGAVDGMLLDDGTEIHFPPHLSTQLLAAVKPGTEVWIRGVRPRGVDMVAAVSLETADGKQVTDHGPPKDQDADKKPTPDIREPMGVEGIVQRVLHGPKGEARGALLEDGRIIRIPPHAAAALSDELTPGRRLAARGDGVTNPLGTVVAAKAIGASLSALQPVEPKKPPEQRPPRPPGRRKEQELAR
jgi:hypothetical protein